MKNSLKTKSHRRQSSLPAPEIVTSDDIAALSDEDLMTQIGKLDEERKKVYDERADTRPWDEELCYFRREAQVRRKRRDIHEKFLKEQERETRDAQRFEKSLPSADLDNTQFMLR